MGQSWNKAHDASKNSYWKNLPSTDTPIVKDELNRNETSVDTIDDRVITLDTTKAEQSDFLGAFLSVTFNSSTGTFTFTKANGTTVVIDTDIEKIAINFDYDDDPTSAHYQQLIIELDDGTYKYVDLSALITEYEFTDTTTIHFAVGNDGSVTANVIDGSITEAKLQPNFLADCRTARTGAENAEADAIAKALVSEGWAKGTQNGTPVGSSSPYYHNNAEYFKDQASQIAGGSIGGLSDVDIDSLSLATGQALIYNSTSQMWENKNLIRPHLIILSETGSVVTATKGTTVISATETSTGHFECDITEFGTWTINAVLGGDDAQVSLVVDTVKVYTVDDSHFHADITVTFPSGGTCSCSKSGETTLYANTNPYTFTVHSSGTWTITATGNGETYTESVNVTTSGQTTSLTIPVGSTVTPTDSVATLLSCAGIDDTSITTLADLFADSTTLLAVISSNNAIDYLVRSTSFAKREALVPTMTSATTPSGEASASSVYQAGFEAWRAFNGIVTGASGSIWHSVASSTAWIQYEFPTNCKVGLIKIWDRESDNIQGTYNVNFKRSSDGEVIKSFSYSPTNNGVHEIVVDNDNSGNVCRLEYTNPASPNNYTIIAELQFYGEEGFTDNSTAMTYIGANNYAANTLLDDATWCAAICNSAYVESVLNVKVPLMTNATTPSGVVSSSNDYNTQFANWRAFMSNNAPGIGDFGWSASVSGWLQYMFAKAMRIKLFRASGQDKRTRMATSKLQGSNDGVTFIDIMNISLTSNTAAWEQIAIASNTTDYQYYRLTDVGETSYGLRFNFLGRVDV